MGKHKKKQITFPYIIRHYKVLPVFYKFAQMPIARLTDKVSRQYIYAGQILLN